MAQGEKHKQASNGKQNEERSKRRKKYVIEEDGLIKFDEEELKNIKGLKRGVNYIEVPCGITSNYQGDYVAKLTINDKGQYFITCECMPGCTTENVTLMEFQKHAGKKEGHEKWKSNIWVNYEEVEKVPLWRTPLLQYYTYQANVANWKDIANGKRNFHRDEFIRCSICNKERRFRLRVRKDIKKYHDALINKTWKCSDWHYQSITCNDAEERSSIRAAGRGCPRAALCKGCSSCYCGGCIKCRFEDCSCQECRDFMLLAEP